MLPVEALSSANSGELEAVANKFGVNVDEDAAVSADFGLKYHLFIPPLAHEPRPSPAKPNART